MKRRGLVWAAVFAGLFLLGMGGFLLLRGQGPAGSIARVYLDGELVREIDLAAVTESYSFELRCEEGYNIVTVSPGAVAVTEADCPDQTCVRQGEITDGAVPIVCMPHRLVIEIEGDFD